MTTSDEDLQKLIADIEEKITKKHIPFTDSDHRKTVDLSRAMRNVKTLQRELETRLSMNLTGQITSYINKAANE
ncbi:MAG: hypothetical protein IH926_03560 [Proteobacteria bacterium]|nr:hypothetical protein [Pseudomonadota bacterium]